jgi:hypothetical protein
LEAAKVYIVFGKLRTASLSMDGKIKYEEGGIHLDTNNFKTDNPSKWLPCTDAYMCA